MQPVKIGLCGLGTVGAGTYNVLTRNNSEITARVGCAVEIVHVGARRNNPACDLAAVKVSADIFAVVDDPNVDIVVEVIGGTDVAFDLVMKAIANGKHVVTANKALIAEHGNEIFAAAEKQGVGIAFEAAVAGGIPIIKALREGLAANKISWLAGIINGTGNFILSEMKDKGRDFSDVLAEAQALGYAEADPTFDVEGIDAAHKLAILSSLAFGSPLAFDQMYIEGISQIERIDVGYADELGYNIKHLGIARKTDTGVELRVHPTLVPQKCLIANVHGVMNAILVEGDAVGSTLYYGPGAGAEPTASAVVADIVDLARTFSAEPKHRVPHLAFHAGAVNTSTIHKIDAVETAYYLRISADDKPGVLSKIAQILSDEGISIEALIQKGAVDGSKRVPIILLTNRTQEAKLAEALTKIRLLDSVADEVVRIRVEALDS